MKIKDCLYTQDPEKGGTHKLSQSRLYLMLSVLLMFVTIIVTLITDVKLERVDLVTNVLLFMIGIFSGYSLTGKGLTMKRDKQ